MGTVPADDAPNYRPQGPIDPLAAIVAEALSAAPISAYPPELTRAALRDACVMTGQPEMARIEDHEVPVTGGETIGVRLYVPHAEPRAVLAWAHGGGFVLGTLDELDNFARLLAERTGCAVASVAYRLAPEYKFPIAVEDLETGALWLAKNAATLGLAGLPLWLGGDSAGGNLATVVTRRLHARNALRIAGNVLAYPNTDTPRTESLRHYTTPFLAAEDFAWFIDHYLPDPEFETHPDYAPLYATDLDLLPPTLVLTAEHDIVTGQAEKYARLLAANGVKVEQVRSPGMIHGFVTLDPFLSGPASAAIDTIGAFIAAARD